MPKNELIVKDVDFYGDTLKAAKDEHGVVWAGVPWLCKGMGMTKDQTGNERKKIQDDLVLSQGVKFHPLGTSNANKEVLCLQLDYVPLWLAKISITPNMKKSNPELVEKLVNYQLKAKDVLAAAFLPQGHNVKQLTITSREIAKIIGKTPANVLTLVRERIEDLESLGFTAEEFYIKSTYHGGNNQDRPQFLLTERGCEDFLRCLEPDKRKIFLQEFPDRFERMQNVLDGRPVVKLPKLICMADVEEKEPQVQLYKTGSGGIVLLDGEVYSLAADEIEALGRFIPEMQKYSIGQIQYAVSAFLKSMKGNGRLEMVASWGLKQEEEQKPLLQDKAVYKPGQGLQTDKGISLDSVENLTELQAKTRYNIGRNNLLRVSDEAGAVVRAGIKRLYSRQILDDYFRRHTE